VNAVERLKGTRQSVKLLAQLSRSVASHKLNLGLFAAQLYSNILTLILTTLPLEQELAPIHLLLSRS
jgi:hypothetical protein